jgi:hypothetical protein
MNTDELPDGAVDEAATAPPLTDAPEQAGPAWEEIAAGRFQPRRVRGSCRGRVLG